ncbi:hypothetical protein [Actinophytocola sp.]
MFGRAVAHDEVGGQLHPRAVRHAVPVRLAGPEVAVDPGEFATVAVTVQ